MRKFACVLAALATVAIAPTAVSAQSVEINTGGGHRDGVRDRGEFRDSHAFMHRDRGWHRGHDKKVIIIKQRGHRHHHD
jgi:hypothetical protein